MTEQLLEGFLERIEELSAKITENEIKFKYLLKENLKRNNLIRMAG